MVKNVANPPRISRCTVEPRAEMLKKRSSPEDGGAPSFGSSARTSGEALIPPPCPGWGDRLPVPFPRIPAESGFPLRNSPARGALTQFLPQLGRQIGRFGPDP